MTSTFFSQFTLVTIVTLGPAITPNAALEPTTPRVETHTIVTEIPVTVTLLNTLSDSPTGLAPTRDPTIPDIDRPDGDSSTDPNIHKQPLNRHLSLILPLVLVGSFLIVILVLFICRRRWLNNRQPFVSDKPTPFTTSASITVTPTFNLRGGDNVLLTQQTARHSSSKMRTQEPAERQPIFRVIKSSIVSPMSSPVNTPSSAQSITRSLSPAAWHVPGEAQAVMPGIQADLLRLQARLADIEAGRPEFVPPPGYSPPYDLGG